MGGDCILSLLGSLAMAYSGLPGVRWLRVAMAGYGWRVVVLRPWASSWGTGIPGGRPWFTGRYTGRYTEQKSNRYTGRYTGRSTGR